MYIKDYSISTNYEMVWETKVPLPCSPKDADIVKTKDNKFKHIDLEYANNAHNLPAKEKKEFVDKEWHKRKNGVWQLIGEKVIYITGLHYTYLNYWRLNNSGRQDNRPQFRWADCLFFYFWDYCVRDVRCYGMFDIKSRRIGDSSKAQFILWEYASRMYSVHCGIQNKTGADAKANYLEICEANDVMPSFFKPINKGTNKPQAGLIFDLPEVKVTLKKKLSERQKQKYGLTDESLKPLKSKITYQVTRIKAYDSKRLERYMMDEPGKMTKADMNPVACWGIVRPCLETDSGATIIGKALLLTTVEDLEPEVLINMEDFWDNADLTKRGHLGRTMNGLYRIFRPADVCGLTDEYGFPNIELNRKNIIAHREELRKARQWGKLAEYIRRYPLTVEEALTPAGESCQFNLLKLQERYKELLVMKHSGNSDLPIKCNLAWITRLKKVTLIAKPDAGDEDEDAQINCSLVLNHEEANKVFTDAFGNLKPGNNHKFVIGVDPYDHQLPDGTKDASRGGAYVKIRFDPAIDGSKVDVTDFPSDDPDNENYLGRGMKTNRTVCTLKYRYNDPYVFYEQVAKMCIYYGCYMMMESQKPGIEKWFIDNGLGAFIWRDQSGKPGLASTPMTINHYYDRIAIRVEHFINNEVHIEVIEEYINMRRDKMTKFDLGVANGFAEILDSQPIYKPVIFAQPVKYYNKFRQTRGKAQYAR